MTLHNHSTADNNTKESNNGPNAHGETEMLPWAWGLLRAVLTVFGFQVFMMLFAVVNSFLCLCRWQTSGY